MVKSVEVNILPCLIKYTGPTEFKTKFKDKIRKLSEYDTDSIDNKDSTDNTDSTSSTNASDSSDSSNSIAIPGGFEMKDICGNCPPNANFSVETTEKLTRDVYYSMKGVDRLLKDNYYILFRGRQMRGSQLALEDFGYKMSVVTRSYRHKQSEFSKATGSPSIHLTKTADVSSVTVWELENDVSPLSDNLAAYKYLLLSKPLSDYEHEAEYFKSLNINSTQ